MNYTNVTNLPQPIFKALTHSDYTKGHSNRSVTQLIDSPRVRILRKEHDDDHRGCERYGLERTGYVSSQNV